MRQAHALKLVALARDKADAKWGRNSGSEGPWKENPFLGVAILTEEVGEVARATLENDDKNLFEELLDVAQVCVAWLESFEAVP